MKTWILFITAAFICISCEDDSYDPMEITVDITNVACSLESNGKIDITVKYGRPPYVFEWSNGSINEDLNQIAAGTYSVKVYDSEGRVAVIQNMLVEQPEKLTIDTNSINNNEIGGLNGIINTTVNGGTPPYSYTWSNGMTTANLENLGKGFYELEVRDNNGCFGFSSIMIQEPIELTLETTLTADLCNPKGEISAAIFGGLEPYEIKWSNGAITQDISNLESGTYECTVTDALSATVVNSVEIVLPEKLKLNNWDFMSDCRVQFNISGGTPPYNPVDGIFPLIEGQNYWTVVDANGCQDTVDFYFWDHQQVFDCE
ncbi:SprB repeat-containing protein [uncultured Aquimarina sp.]|uniref:SprB repeat-containing protein n=1 Tax=uncultured Aquimarina sp. TaxID=575652 RepID=UPI0026227985|nr:SprB repeat-containing protein [uncultured Aquimarina sp.]